MLRSQLGVVGDAGEHARRVLAPQAIQGLLGLGESSAQVNHGLGELGQVAVGVDQHVAECGKVLGLGIQSVVGLPAAGHNVHQHGAPLILGFGDGVVELRADAEGALQGSGGVVERAHEAAGAFRPEFGGGHVEFGAGLAYRFIRGHQLFLRELFQHVNRQRHQTTSVFRVDGPRISRH